MYHFPNKMKNFHPLKHLHIFSNEASYKFSEVSPPKIQTVSTETWSKGSSVSTKWKL